MYFRPLNHEWLSLARYQIASSRHKRADGFPKEPIPLGWLGPNQNLLLGYEATGRRYPAPAKARGRPPPNGEERMN